MCWFKQGQANATLNIIMQPDTAAMDSSMYGSSTSAYELVGVNPWSGEVVYRAMLTNEQQVQIVQLGYA